MGGPRTTPYGPLDRTAENDDEVVANIRSWKHSGSSVDQSVRLEAGDGAVHLGGVDFVSLLEIRVLVPLLVRGNAQGAEGMPVIDLNETDAAFGETPGLEALLAEVPGPLVVHSIERKSGGGQLVHQARSDLDDGCQAVDPRAHSSRRSIATSFS